MFEWYEKLVKKFPKKMIGDIIVAKALLSLAIGSVFSTTLILYSRKIMLLITLLLLFYVYSGVLSWHQNKKTTPGMQITGLSALYIMFLFVGIQSSTLSWKITLGLSGVFFLLALFHMKK